MSEIDKLRKYLSVANKRLARLEHLSKQFKYELQKVNRDITLINHIYDKIRPQDCQFVDTDNLDNIPF